MVERYDALTLKYKAQKHALLEKVREEVICEVLHVIEEERRKYFPFDENSPAIHIQKILNAKLDELAESENV